jgi:hypothetical protein
LVALARTREALHNGTPHAQDRRHADLLRSYVLGD